MTPHVSITLLRTQTDERLVELIAAGHDRAFDAIVDRYRRPLLRYARRFLHEECRAEDVVQAAFVSAWGALRDGAPVRDLRPWLYRIVHNGALNVMKKPGSDDAPLIEASDLRPGPATEVEQREDVRQALDTIAALPDRQRAALLAVALEGRSHADIGVELGLNDTAVRQLVRRARATLRVAATAITPWPAAVWLAGIGGAQATDTATRVGEVVGGVGAGTVFGGGAMKAGAIVAAAGAFAVGVPQVDHVVRTHHRPAAAQAAAAQTAAARADADTDAGPGGTAGPATRLVSTPTATTVHHVAAPGPTSGNATGPGSAVSTRHRDVVAATTARPTSAPRRAAMAADPRTTGSRARRRHPATSPATTCPQRPPRPFAVSTAARRASDATRTPPSTRGPRRRSSPRRRSPSSSRTRPRPPGSGSGSTEVQRETEDSPDTEQSVDDSH